MDDELKEIMSEAQQGINGDYEQFNSSSEGAEKS